jgi:hypothetical protein
VRAYLDITSASRIGQRMRLSPAMAVGLVTLKYQREQAEAFWRATSEANRLEAGSPELVLREYLMLTPVARRDPAAMARVVAGCWNAAVEGRTFQRRPNERSDLSPIRIAGTPYDGRAVLIPDDA